MPQIQKNKSYFAPMVVITWDELKTGTQVGPIAVQVDNSVGFIPIYDDEEKLRKDYPDALYFPVTRKTGGN